MGDTEEQQRVDFFISRASADAAFASEIGRILEDDGKSVILQQWDFANRNFMERMHWALGSGARVIALLSSDYLASAHCEAEWQNAIGHDPLNRQGRLIVMRVAECVPTGLLTALAYWDLVPVHDDRDLVRDIVLTAVAAGRHKSDGSPLGPYWREARAIVHKDIRPTPNFTGREQELAAIEAAFSSGGATAVTQPMAVHGLGGIGKSVLAREFALRFQDRYAGLWWLNAAKPQILQGFEGVETALVELGAIFIRGLDQVDDREKAARHTLQFLADGGFDKPWLFVYDNVDDARVLREWAPKGNVHVLLTTRLSGWPSTVRAIEIEEWSMPDAIDYLLCESGRGDLSAADAEEISEALGRLPLALSHAAAYLRVRKTITAASYLAGLTRRMSDAPGDAEYGRAVFATFQQALEEAESEARGAQAVLSLAAFFAPDDIPEELFRQTLQFSPPILPELMADPEATDEAIGALAHLSLIDFNSTRRSFSVHRLVQAAARDRLDVTTAKAHAAAALRLVSAALPRSPQEHTNWPVIGALLSHALATAEAGERLEADLETAARVLDQIADYHEARGAYADAEPLYRRAINVTQKALGADSVAVADLLVHLTRLLPKTHRFDEAERGLLQALALYGRARVHHADPRVITAMNNLASICHATGQYDRAERLYIGCCNFRMQTLGQDHPTVALTLNNLASVYKDTGRYAEAEPLYKMVIDIGRKAHGAQHPKVATWENNLAELYRLMQRYSLAEPLYESAIATGDKVLGGEHPDLATWLHNLALLYIETGRLAAAAPLLRRALAMREKTTGSDDPIVAKWRASPLFAICELF